MTSVRRACKYALLGCVLVLTANAEVLEVGNDHLYKTACEAIRAAESGDIVVLEDGIFAGSCAWSTPGLTIRGKAGGAVVAVEAEGPTWQIAADDTTVENITFSGEKATDAGGAAIELSGRSLTLRHVRIHGAAIGVRALEVAGSRLTIENSKIFGNRTNVLVRQIEQLNISESYVHDATHGDSIDTEAIQNTFRNNRLGSREAEGTRREVLIRDSQLTSFAGNVIRRGDSGENGVLIQYLSTAESAGEIEVSGNTFLSDAPGVVFVEAAGTAAPRARIDRNVFWGDGVVDSALGAELARSNFFGAAPELNAAANSEAVPSEWGAPAALLADIAEPVVEASTSVKSSALAATVSPAISSLTLSSSTVVAGSYTKGNIVRLAAAAPTGGVYVQLASSNRTIAYPSSSVMYIPAGGTSGVFVLQTSSAASSGYATITASLSGSSRSATISTMNSVLKSVTVEKSQVGSNGTLRTNRVYLSGPAPAGGMVVNLSASNSYVSVPSTVTVAAGVSSAAFPITARSVAAPQLVVITASHATGRQTASLTVMPLAVEALEIMPAITAGGGLIGVKAWLNGPAPAGGFSILLSSSDSSTVSVPSVVSATGGALYGSATVQTRPVTSTRNVTLTAATGGTRKSAVVTVREPGLYSVVSSSSARTGSQLSVTVKLDGAALSSTVVAIRSSNSALLAVPASVTIPAGSSSASFITRAGATSTSTAVTISAIADGVTKTRQVTVSPY